MATSDTEYVILSVLEEGDIAQMNESDPVEFATEVLEMPPRKLVAIVIGTIKPEERGLLADLMREERVQDAFLLIGSRRIVRGALGVQ